MNFCTNCDNMYYLSIPAETASASATQDAPPADTALVYYCKNCGYIDKTLAATNTKILKTNINTHFALSKINEYTKFDPTLPIVDTIDCPNEKCSTHSADKPSAKKILFIRYDDANMKYVYLCSTCDHVWKITT